MPKYYGSRQDVHTPFMRAPRMEHTPDQVNAWWDTLAQGAHDDLHISRDLNREPAALYFLNDNGVLTPAVRSGDDLGSPAVRGRLLDQSRAGRLFVRGLGDDYPRQIITDENYNAGITAPTNTLPAVEGNPPPSPAVPPSSSMCWPSLWTPTRRRSTPTMPEKSAMTSPCSAERWCRTSVKT